MSDHRSATPTEPPYTVSIFASQLLPDDGGYAELSARTVARAWGFRRPEGA